MLSNMHVCKVRVKNYVLPKFPNAYLEGRFSGIKQMPEEKGLDCHLTTISRQIPEQKRILHPDF